MEIDKDDEEAHKDYQDEGDDWDFDAPPTISSRTEWGARPAKPMEALSHPVKNVRFTYTGTDQCRSREECHAVLQKLQRDHMENEKLPDIMYNFMVGGDEAIIFEGRGWYADADRPKKHDNLRGDCIDIAFIGTFEPTRYPRIFEIATLPAVRYGQIQKFIHNDPNIIGFDGEIVVSPTTLEE